MKNVAIHVYAKTAFVRWPSTETLSINFLSYNYYFRKYLNRCIEKCGYGNFYHRYNVSPIHLHASFGVGNFTKVVHVCADRLWSGLRLRKVGETLRYKLNGCGQSSKEGFVDTVMNLVLLQFLSIKLLMTWCYGCFFSPPPILLHYRWHSCYGN
jgi:hypothetical protein